MTPTRQETVSPLTVALLLMMASMLATLLAVVWPWQALVLALGLVVVTTVRLVRRGARPGTVGLFAWALVSGLCLVAGAREGFARRTEVTDAGRRRDAEAAAQERAQVERLARLRREAAQRVTEGNAARVRAETALDAGQFAQALEAALEARRRLAALEALRPSPEGWREAFDAMSRAQQRAEQLVATERLLADTAALVAETAVGDAVIDLDGRLDAHHQALGAVAGESRTRLAAPLRQAQGSVARRRRALAGSVTRARRAQAEREALLALCGTPPGISPWDGELIGAERYVRQSANDPGSIDVEHCTTPVLTRNRCWVSTCSMLGRNAFGAMIRRQVRFSVGAQHQYLGMEYAD